MSFRTSFLLITIVFTGYSCSRVEYDNAASLLAIEEAMAEQEKSWSEGDIDGFMKYYQKSDELSFTSKNGLTKGYNTLLKRYKENYLGEKEMGQLTFELLQHRSLGNEHMLVVGSWKLQNDGNNPSGYFSLIWKNTSKGWKIIHDHTS